MRHRITNILVGVIILAVGLGIIGKALNLWDINFIFFSGWWTLFLIIPGVLSIIDNGFRLGNSLLTLIGGALLLEEQNILPNVRIWPLIIGCLVIVVGIKVIFGDSFKGHKSHKVNYDYVDVDYKEEREKRSGSYDSQERPSYFAMFSGINMKNDSPNLQGGEVTTIFGSVDVDFYHADVNRDISLSLCAIFGGIEIVAPRGTRVIVKGMPIFGGYDNLCKTVGDNNAPIVTINCFVLFGGVEVR